MCGVIKSERVTNKKMTVLTFCLQLPDLYCILFVLKEVLIIIIKEIKLKNFIKLTVFAVLFISVLHVPTTEADIASDDMEVITVYGTSYEMDSMWELLSFEYEYPFVEFKHDFQALSEEEALEKACDTANNNKPDGCTST